MAQELARRTEGREGEGSNSTDRNYPRGRIPKIFFRQLNGNEVSSLEVFDVGSSKGLACLYM